MRRSSIRKRSHVSSGCGNCAISISVPSRRLRLPSARPSLFAVFPHSPPAIQGPLEDVADGGLRPAVHATELSTRRGSLPEVQPLGQLRLRQHNLQGLTSTAEKVACLLSEGPAVQVCPGTPLSTLQLIVTSADLSSSWLSGKCSPTGSIATDCHEGVVPKRFIESWSPTPRRRSLGGPDPESVHTEN